ncbi:VOC family protein [Actinospica sp.]|uniref:VOC family protein n=1 Tax=Actinospica sp. TaxID=1872142 RepID=UPI002D027FD3|nr:VOC family protein [Actinospica sp.]HWG25573.1 VOC family protein [Actinospica sp.]
MTATEDPRRYDVGGYWQPRPFRVTRLGHVGLNCTLIDESLHFYRDLLGLRVSDRMDFKGRIPDPSVIEGLGDTGGYFMRHGTEHHSFVLFNKRVREAVDTKRDFRPQVTINQISWHVNSLQEVVDGEGWLREHGQRIQRAGRDMPGSNWHTYFYDVDGHTNELFYGMEQVGWQSSSKPLDFYKHMLRETAKLPQISENEEINNAIADGIDLNSGQRNVPTAPGRHDVGGVLASRPFKITRIGPLRLFVDDVDDALAFYRDVLGLRVTEEVEYDGLRGVLLRAGTEHHSIAVYSIGLRERLGLSPHSTTFAIGMQVGGYRQLRNARAYLLEQGLTEVKLPAELFPGIPRAFRLRDPDGHVIELYDTMRQVVSPPPEGPHTEAFGDEWPETLDDDGTPFLGEPYLGPVE